MMLRDNYPTEVLQLFKNKTNFFIRQMLKYLSNEANIARWQGVRRDIQMPERYAWPTIKRLVVFD
jgi:hypothetical protein